MIGYGHYGHRMMFDDEDTSGSPQATDKSLHLLRDMQSNLGKVIRLNDDGSIPSDNPFVDYRAGDPLVDRIGIYGEVWSLGHRNPLGIDTDQDGQLWVIEMGPFTVTS